MTKFSVAPLKTQNKHSRNNKPVTNPEYLTQKSHLNLSQAEAIVSFVGVLIDEQIKL
jgi:hypothetical protein